MPNPPLIPIETLFKDPEFAGAKISHDGERIAYLAPNYGRLQVWVRGIKDEHEQAICVTRDERRGIFRFQWTDDPRYLLYYQDTDGNEDWHLYRVDVENPEADLGHGCGPLDCVVGGSGGNGESTKDTKGHEGARRGWGSAPMPPGD